MDKPKEMMKCNICGQIVGIRKGNPYGAFPVKHRREGRVDNCHGFYVEGFRVKENG